MPLLMTIDCDADDGCSCSSACECSSSCSFFTVRLTCPEMAVCVSGNAVDVYSKHKSRYIALVGCIPRWLARAIAPMVVRVRTLAPQPSEFYDLVPREAGEPFRSGLSP